MKNTVIRRRLSPGLVVGLALSLLYCASTAPPVRQPPVRQPPAVASAAPAPPAQPPAPPAAAPAPAPTPAPEPLVPADRACRAAVLVYHSLAYHRANETRAEHNVTTSPEAFAQHMRYLHENGFAVVSYDQLVACLTRGTDLPDKAVVITFDDGLASQYVRGLPILEQYHFPATFFIVTGFVGTHRLLMSWDQVRDLDARGFTVGSHTIHHPNLTGLSPERLARELTESKREIETQVGHPVTLFAYPFGYFNDAVATAVQGAGYASARTIGFGKVHHPADLYRLRIVYAPDNLAAFRHYVTP